MFEKELSKLRSGKTENCTCSLACKFIFSESKVANKIITEFPIPKANRNMKLGGVAITKEGAIWIQSYIDPAKIPLKTCQNMYRDFVLKGTFPQLRT